jgi:alpha-glucosidase (family GH31 glycosyl hydrolase)
MCRRDILVAPIMHSYDENPRSDRDVYLPLGYFWYTSNLRPWDDQGKALGSPAEGGTVIKYTAKITNNYEDFPYVTPVFIREGERERERERENPFFQFTPTLKFSG